MKKFIGLIIKEQPVLQHRFRYLRNDVFSFSKGRRGIRGEDIIQWIVKNNFEDVTIFSYGDALAVYLVDKNEPEHYIEMSLNWDLNKPLTMSRDDYMHD